MEHTLISAENTWALFAILAAIATLAVYLEQKTKIGSKITGCVMALIGAMILSNVGIIPLDAPAYDFVWDYIIPLAIPMLLFNADIKKIGRESGRLLIIYLQEQRVSIGVSVEIAIVSVLREVIVNGVLETDWHQILAVCLFLITMAVLMVVRVWLPATFEGVDPESKVSARFKAELKAH